VPKRRYAKLLQVLSRQGQDNRVVNVVLVDSASYFPRPRLRSQTTTSMLPSVTEGCGHHGPAPRGCLAWGATQQANGARTGFLFKVHAPHAASRLRLRACNEGHDTRAIQDWLGHRSNPTHGQIHRAIAGALQRILARLTGDGAARAGRTSRVLQARIALQSSGPYGPAIPVNQCRWSGERCSVSI
jgi:hypothetical protein